MAALCGALMGPRGSLRIPCSWDCHDKTQTIFFLVPSYGSTCKTHGLATGAVVCPSKPARRAEVAVRGEQGDERFSGV